MRAVIHKGLPMRTTTVKRVELLEIVRNNRSLHIQDYDDACEGYREEALKLLMARADTLASEVNSLGERLKAGETVALTFKNHLSFNIPVPESHLKDYDQVIRMLELEVDETVKLQSDEFACFVMDDWDWREKFNSTVSSYKSK